MLARGSELIHGVLFGRKGVYELARAPQSLVSLRVGRGDLAVMYKIVFQCFRGCTVVVQIEQ